MGVSEFFKNKYSDKKQVICADNDIETEKRTGKNAGKIYAEKASMKTGSDICLCPVNSDFNDLFIAKGKDAVLMALKKTYSLSPWKKIVPLKKETGEKINPNLLSGILGKMVSAVSDATETPLELSLSLALVTIATTLQKKFVVEVNNDYFEPLNLWTMVSLPPANRKSAVLSKITSPLLKWENKKCSELQPLIDEKISKKKNDETRLNELRKKYGRKKKENLEEIQKEIIEIESSMEEIPEYPQIWAQDITPEQLGVIMAKQNGKMSILSDEGGIFETISGRYSKGVPNLDLFLQGHSGGDVRIDRGSKSPVKIENTALSLGLTVQPDVIMGLSKKPSFRGRGLIGRFLYFIPKSNLGYRDLISKPVPDKISNDYEKLIFTLLDIPSSNNGFGEDLTDNFGKTIPYKLKLSNEAHNKWRNFSLDIEKEFREGGDFEFLSDWGGKLAGAVIRISGILHCANNPDEPWKKEISSTTMEKSIELGECFSNHSKLAIELMGGDESISHTQKIIRWVKRNQLESFSKRECHSSLKGTFKKSSELDEPLSILVDKNYLQLNIIKTGGRPSEKYVVNPEITDKWKI